MKYVKKPIPVDAWQIDTLEIEHNGNYPDFVAEGFNKGSFHYGEDEGRRKCLLIHTLEGTMRAYDRDYLIRGPEGEWWFVKKNIFEKTYDEYIAPRERFDPYLEVVENADGGATLKFEMHPDDLKTFAKKGVMAVLMEAVKKIEEEHGVD